MRNVLIIGAASAIAERYARLEASRGSSLFLVARYQPRLEAIAADLRQRTQGSVHTHVLDVNDIDRQETMVEAAWKVLGRVDVVLIAHGTLPDQAACNRDLRLALREFATNATSTIALMAVFAQQFEQQGNGTLAVISSVAGDRGRASNYLYGSAKAAVTAYTSGLRQRFNGTAIGVVTIKPGFVDTPMTSEFKKGMLWASPDQVAGGIVRAIDQRRGVAYVPWFWAGIMLVIKHIPEFLFRRIKL